MPRSGFGLDGASCFNNKEKDVIITFMKRDEKYIAQVEQAISKKYGEETIQHPRKNWDEDKEKDYLEQLSDQQSREDHHKDKNQTVKENDILVDKRLLNKRVERTCLVCDVYSFSLKDDVYNNRYGCCYKCYMEYVEGREARWETGWRPEQDEVKNRRSKKNNSRRGK